MEQCRRPPGDSCSSCRVTGQRLGFLTEHGSERGLRGE